MVVLRSSENIYSARGRQSGKFLEFLLEILRVVPDLIHFLSSFTIILNFFVRLVVIVLLITGTSLEFLINVKLTDIV